MHRPNGHPMTTERAPGNGVVPCPDCGGTVSLRAPACVHCGRPMDDVAALARSMQQGTLQSEPPIVDVASDRIPTPTASTRPADTDVLPDSQHIPGRPSVPELSAVHPQPASGTRSPAAVPITQPSSPTPHPQLPPPAPETRLARPGAPIPDTGPGASPAPVSAAGNSSAAPKADGWRPSAGSRGSSSRKAGASAARSAAKLPAGVGKGATKATTRVAGAILRDPLAIGALVAGQVALLLSYSAYERGSTIGGMAIAAAVIVLTWVLGSVAKKRAERAGIKRAWIVPLARLLALGSAVLLGLAGYAYAKGYLPDVTLPPLPTG